MQSCRLRRRHDGRGVVLGPFMKRKMLPLMANVEKDDLLLLKDMVDTGKLTPVIDRTYPLSATPEAIRYVEAGHARGKVVVV
jgi:NADPH:quinone reductase-like Zn-dependent oxidoreductase